MGSLAERTVSFPFLPPPHTHPSFDPLTNVHRGSPNSPEAQRQLHIHRKLHPKLGLAHSRDATWKAKGNTTHHITSHHICTHICDHWCQHHCTVRGEFYRHEGARRYQVQACKVHMGTHIRARTYFCHLAQRNTPTQHPVNFLDKRDDGRKGGLPLVMARASQPTANQSIYQ